MGDFFSVIEIIHPQSSTFLPGVKTQAASGSKSNDSPLLLWINEKHLRIQLFLSASSSIPAGHSHLTPTGLNKHR